MREMLRIRVEKNIAKVKVGESTHRVEEEQHTMRIEECIQRFQGTSTLKEISTCICCNRMMSNS